MKLRRVLPLLTLLALLVAPFGRMAAAEAMTSMHEPSAATTGHCDEMPMPAQDGSDRPHKAGVDCMIACAAMASAEASALSAATKLASPQARFSLPEFAGLHPEAEPPPPRLS